MKIIVHNDGRGSLFGAKPTDPQLLMVIPLLEGRRVWRDRGRVYSFEPTPYNLEKFARIYPGIEIERAPSSPSSGFSADFSAAPIQPYMSASDPWPHQPGSTELCLDRPQYGLFHEQGTGKTKIAVDVAGTRWCNRQITGVLVVAPKGVHRQWIDQQVPEHLGKMVKWRGHWYKGTPRDREAAKVMVGDGALCWLSIGVDAMKTRKGMLLCQQFLLAHGGGKQVLMIIDESHNIKNYKSGRWAAADELGKQVPYRMILTGTPIAKNLEDEWAQLKWLNEGILGQRYVTTFRNEYCVMAGKDRNIVVGHRNFKKFLMRTKPWTDRVTKKEIGILPKTHEVFKFDLTPSQKKQMAEIKNDLKVQIDSGELVKAANAVVAIGKMQQISCGFINDKQGKAISLFPEPKKNPRIVALLDLLASFGEQKVVIWAKHIHDIEQIMSVLGDQAVAYYGAVSDGDRERNKKVWLDGGSDILYFVSNPSTGGTGLNLQGACCRAVYYSNSHNSIHRWQSEDRIDRIGASGACVYTDVIAKASLDLGILRNLAKKKAISQMGLGELRAWLDDEGDVEETIDVIKQLNSGSL